MVNCGLEIASFFLVKGQSLVLRSAIQAAEQTTNQPTNQPT